MALAIAGERSGVGKTTITLSLLAVLRQRQLSVQSFKVGPDYIDPMFHRYVTGRACRNLDPVLTSEAYVQQSFSKHTQTVDYALVEGVMGLFDGATGADDTASTAHVARLLNLPVLLVIDCSRLSRSAAAIALGYRSFDPRLEFAGIVLNRVGSDRHLELLKAALEPLDLPILGVFRRHDDIAIPDRHLGLVPTAELPVLDTLIERLANLGESCFDWLRLLPLLKTRSSLSIAKSSIYLDQPAALTLNSSPYREGLQAEVQKPKAKIAVACDRAFSFYYADNLERLEELGAALVFWSPLADPALPTGVQGLYLGGGFPEVFAAALADNQSAQQSVRQAIQAGMPTYAECGGLMYLCEQIVDFEGQSWKMVGILPTIAKMTGRLTLGYRRAIALQDSPLLVAGSETWGHEFHRSSLSAKSALPLYQTGGYDSDSLTHLEGWRSHQLHASYIHLHWGSHPEIPTRFLQCCLKFGHLEFGEQP
ncbi:MAG: cobyrinate a,c-diamide synthase [Leptolyngbyaceae cyanobacterium RM1_406_9]|nr:cobyrinate a,c-diamide synthase [Leptolyngbyaceae cyanobacterium RM1_406_9]